jgi:hypothetical protein
MLSLLNLRVIILSCIISQFPAMRFTCGSTTRDVENNKERSKEHSQINYRQYRKKIFLRITEEISKLLEADSRRSLFHVIVNQ